MFQQYLDTIKSNNTRSTYTRGLAYFETWARGAGVDVASLRVRDISAFRDHLNGALSGSSANVYLSALRAFLRWAAERELVEPAIYQACAVVSNVKTPERLPTVLKAEEVETLLCQPDASTLTGARDLAFVSLLVPSWDLVRGQRIFGNNPWIELHAALAQIGRAGALIQAHAIQRNLVCRQTSLGVPGDRGRGIGIRQRHAD